MPCIVGYLSLCGRREFEFGRGSVASDHRRRNKATNEPQAAEVSRPLASVKRICEAGHTVVFDDTGSFILNKATGEINALREECGNYMLDLWVPPTNELGFARP